MVGIMDKYKKFGIEVLGNCERCGTTIFNIACRYKNADNKFLCTDCGEELRQKK